MNNPTNHTSLKNRPMTTVLHSKRVDFEYGVLSAAYTG